MELQSLHQAYGVYSSNEIQSVSRRKQEEKNSPLATGDTVSISDEARALLSKMIANAGGTSQSGQDKTSERPDLFAPAAEQATPTAASAPLRRSGDTENEDSDSDEQAEKIEKKIKELSAQIKAVMSSDSTAETKQTQAAPLLQQVAALQQQLTKLTTSKSRTQA